LTEAGMTYMTLAPELPGGLELVSSLIDWGVIVSCGHSDTDAETANHAYDLGARTVTHLFNAHRPLRARDPGLGGVVLTRPDVFAQMILDGHHLASETARLVTSTCRGRLVLVTDAMEAATLAEGSYQIGGSPVHVADGTVRLADGTLAGSVLTLDQAVRNFIQMGTGLEEAVAAVTTVPARLLGRADLGSSRPGSRADLVVLDEAGEVVRTVIAGEERFRR
jgi:N-acetylglucosamine-6-phosphate deacetylase